MQTKQLELIDHINWCVDAHQNHPNTSRDSVRFWDMKTPYSIHPVWCAMTLLAETSLKSSIREPGAIALLYHDVLEDTSKGLPVGLSASVVNLIKGVTFDGGIDEEIKTVWQRGDEIILLKLYDKVSNLLDAVWMTGQKRKEYIDYSSKLNKHVLNVFGELNITKIAAQIVK